MQMPRRAKPWFRESEGTWYVRLGGRQVSLRVRGRDNEAAAWRAYEQLVAGKPAAPSAATPAAGLSASRVSVGDVIAEFLRDAAERLDRRETLDLYRGFLTPFAERFGKMPAASLTCPIVESYSRRPNWNDSTRSAFLAVVARAFHHAERCRTIDRTPLVGLRKPPIASRAADAMVTAADHDKLAAVAPPPFRRFLAFLFHTGCRPSEAARLTADDVDWITATAVIRR
jgi:integrase